MVPKLGGGGGGGLYQSYVLAKIKINDFSLNV